MPTEASYWKAGDEIPDDEIPPAIRKYAVTGNGEPKVPAAPKIRTSSQTETAAQEPKQKLRKRYVRRGIVWRRAKDVAVKIGEAVFVRLAPNDYEEIGKVSSDGNLPAARL